MHTYKCACHYNAAFAQTGNGKMRCDRCTTTAQRHLGTKRDYNGILTRALEDGKRRKTDGSECVNSLYILTECLADLCPSVKVLLVFEREHRRTQKATEKGGCVENVTLEEAQG